MKYIGCLFVIFLLACNGHNSPDVSGIKINLQTERFDNDFFKIDTNQIPKSVKELDERYPGFMIGFVQNIMGLQMDSLMFDHSASAEAVRQFIRDYTPIKDSSDRVFKDFSKWNEKIVQGLKYVKYYFPKYTVPKKVIVFLGPVDAFFQTSYGIQGDILTPGGIGVGLQLHLGGNFSFYKSEQGQNLYPEYISRFFDAEHIPINAMKVIADDLFPPSNQSASMIEQMVISGRKYYLLEKFLPDYKEEDLLDYTSNQLKAAYKNEAVIWDFFLNNNLLNNSDPDMIKNYIGPSPKTQEFGDGSPGNIGSFAGLQIVKKFMNQNPETTLEQLMQIPPRQVYERSKYKPKG